MSLKGWVPGTRYFFFTAGFLTAEIIIIIMIKVFGK